MDSGIYAACAALVARTQSLDSVANNLANTATSGYRAQHSEFRSVFAHFSGRPSNDLEVAVNDFGVLGNNRIDLSQGALERTDNPLDFALQGTGFFAVQTKSGRVLTRNGSFHLSPQGQLVTTAGDPVLGTQGTITIPTGAKLDVSPDGTLSVDGAAAGRLSIVDIRPGTELESIGDQYYSAPAQNIISSDQTRVVQGAVEGSNVDPVAATVDLILTQRNAEMMQRALSIFHNEFNKTAANELPRL